MLTVIPRIEGLFMTGQPDERSSASDQPHPNGKAIPYAIEPGADVGQARDAQPSSRLSVFMFTDLVDSSKLARQLGDADYVRYVLEPHNTIFRRLLEQCPGARE